MRKEKKVTLDDVLKLLLSLAAKGGVSYAFMQEGMQIDPILTSLVADGTAEVVSKLYSNAKTDKDTKMMVDPIMEAIDQALDEHLPDEEYCRKDIHAAELSCLMIQNMRTEDLASVEILAKKLYESYCQHSTFNHEFYKPLIEAVAKIYYQKKWENGLENEAMMKIIAMIANSIHQNGAEKRLDQNGIYKSYLINTIEHLRQKELKNESGILEPPSKEIQDEWNEFIKAKSIKQQVALTFEEIRKELMLIENSPYASREGIAEAIASCRFFMETFQFEKSSKQICNQLASDKNELEKKWAVLINLPGYDGWQNKFKYLVNVLFKLQKENKLFLTVGEKGDGKTHFYTWVLEQSQTMDESYVVYIDLRTMMNDRIESNVLAEINFALGTAFTNYQEINCALAELEKKLIVCIDHLDYEILNPKRREVTLSCLDKLTSNTMVDRVFWSLSIRERSLEYLTSISSKYEGGAIFADEIVYMPSTFMRVGKWIDIHECNIGENVALKMLSNLYDGKMDEDELEYRLTRDGSTLHYFTPGRVMLFRHYLEKENQNTPSIQKLNSISFANEVKSSYFEAVESRFCENTGYPRYEIEPVINNICLAYLDEPKESFQQNEIVNSIEGMTGAEKGNLLDVLILEYMLKELKWNTLTLDTDIVWALEMARVIDARKEDWLAQCGKLAKSSLYDGVFGFVLQLKQQYATEPWAGKWTKLIQEKNFWFAIVDLERTQRDACCEQLLASPFTPQKEITFAFLYFLKYAETDKLTYIDRISLINKLYLSAKELNLGEYVFSVIRYAIRECKDILEFWKGLQYYIGCEFMNETDELCDCLVKKLSTFVPDRDALMKAVVEYSQKNYLLIESNLKVNPDNQDRRFFQGFYSAVCRYYLDLEYSNEINFKNIFDAWYDNRWYYVDKYKRDGRKITRKYCIWLRQAANLEMGLYYRNGRMNMYSETYLELIDYLISKGGNSNDELAFYLIKHSVPKREDRIVSEEMYPRLEIVYNRSFSKKLRENDNKKFFLENKKHRDLLKRKTDKDLTDEKKDEE